MKISIGRKMAAAADTFTLALLVLVRHSHSFSTSTLPITRLGIGSGASHTATSQAWKTRSREMIPHMTAGLLDDLSFTSVTKGLTGLRENVQSEIDSQLSGLTSGVGRGGGDGSGMSLPDVHLPKLPQLQSVHLTPVSDLNGDRFSELMRSLKLPTVQLLPGLENLHAPTSPKALEMGFLHPFTAAASQALDSVVAANPALATPLAHLQSSLAHSTAALEQAYAAGVTLIPEQYQAAVVICAAGAASTALGMSLASAAEAAKVESTSLPPTGNDLPLPRSYDLPAIMNYYNRRPSTLLGRLFAVSYRLGTLAAKLWVDRNVGDGSGWERNMPARAEEFVDFVQGAGPTFIKIGQGVSIRPDILPEPYLRELVKLQDKVKPFDSGNARAILTQQLGRPLGEVFMDADTAFEVPVAAASLGQVYRATLRSGEAVAVKVQRPDVLESVTLDLYVIRLLLLFLARWDSARESSLSLLAVIDNWADRFLQELDYLQEAANGDRFRTEMAASKTLGEAIVVPRVFLDFTTRYMLVTEWVEGVKVDAIDSTTGAGRERLGKIVATLLNSYLAQLLESGFLHADPHPGNFLCTPDGRLCVLDMGLMTEVEEDQRYALLEYVSHLTAKDYEATLNDLIVLGFIPKEIGDDPKKAAIVAPLLATVLEQLSNGGGAKAVTVESVGEEIEELGRQYPIVIPAYFGLIIRAFSALEGLGLQLDPQYSIVNECFPYLARRLLTEDSDRMRKMLRTFLYGKDDRYLQVDRVDDLVEGYAQFTVLADEASKGVVIEGLRNPLGAAAAPSHTAIPAFQGGFVTPIGVEAHESAVSSAPAISMPAEQRRSRQSGRRRDGGWPPAVALASVSRGTRGDVDGEDRGVQRGGGSDVDSDPVVQDPVARDALKLLFAKEGNYVQELVVEELVRMTDALSREANLQVIKALRTLTEAPLSPARIAKALAEAPLNPLLAPLQVPAKAQAFALSRVFNRLEVALELTQEDQESLKALRRLQELLQGGIGGGGSGGAAGSGNDSRTTSRLPIGFPPLPGFPLLPGTAGWGVLGFENERVMGPREAVDAARQLAGLASLIGPGMVTIVQKFLVQLAARTLDRLADSFDSQGKSFPLEQASAPSRGRFYDGDDDIVSRL